MELGIGIVEGFYGTPWSMAERKDTALFLKSIGGHFYLYAPKGDPFLRKQWKERLPFAHADELRAVSENFRKHGIAFGVGLSPYELYRSFNSEARTELREKIVELESLGLDHLAILFDDMRGDLPNLARMQIEILDFIRAQTKVKEISFCPTYYSDDPVLDRVFGTRPAGYLEELARGIDPSIRFFWTGEKVCSPGYTVDYLERVSRDLGRRPLIWDNYPVNDGQKMCKYLHLSPFTGRPSAIREHVSGFAVNPMNQAWLSRIPMRTLFTENAADAWRVACETEFGREFTDILAGDVELFHRQGLDAITDDSRAALLKKYSSFTDPPAREAAREIRDWLRGEYQVTRELVLTQ